MFKSLTAIEISKKWDSDGNAMYFAKTTPEFMWGCNLYMILTDDNEITGIVNTGLGGNNDLFSYDVACMTQGDFIAVYPSSHVGNGMLVLVPISKPSAPKYGIPDAVDGDYEDMQLTAVQYGLASENDENVTASAIYLGGKLHAEYVDLNQDGNTDIVLIGIQQIYQTGINFREQILRKEYYVKNVYLYDPMKDDFIFSDEMSEMILVSSY